MKKILAMILVMLMLTSILSINLFSITASAISTNEIKTKFDNLKSQVGFGAGQTVDTSLYTNGGSCFAFVDLVCRRLFGHGIPSNYKTNKYQFIDDYVNNFDQIGSSLTYSSGNLTQTNLKNLFLNAQCGDIIQMRYTKIDGSRSQHTMVVYAVNESGVIFYHSGTANTVWFGQSSGDNPLYGTSGSPLTWANFIKYFKNAGDGISVYRSKKIYSSCIAHNYATKYESGHPHAEYKLCNCGSKIYTGNHKKVTNCSLCENPLSYSFTTVEGKTVYTYSKQYDVTVTIFSHNRCNNSKKLIQAIAQNSTLLKNTTQVLFVDANKNTKQTVSDLKKSLGATKVEFCYDLSNKAYNAMWKYANDAGFGNSITLPLVVFTKKDGTVFKVLQGEVDPDYFFQLAKGDLSQDMSVNLNISGTENYDYANEVLKKLNDLRKRLNLQTLTMDQNLLTAAMQRAAEISIYYSHTRPNGTTCSTVSTSTKINAENIAIGQNNPAAVMNSWTNSSGHYANMTTADFKSVGIGCFTTSEGYLCWVQVFSKDSPTTVSKSGTVSAAHVIKANAAHLSLALYVDKDPHLLKKGESTKLRVENINKGFDRIVQKLNISDFSFKSNNDVVSFNSVGNCTAYGTGKVTITAEHKQSESVKALGLYTIGHNYTNSCDTICNICKAKRTIKHKYTNACDTTCNVCKAKRTIKHTYSNNCDTSCNVCKATRTIIHAYKTTTTKATLTENGSIVKKCRVCSKIASKSTIKYVKSFKLSTKTYTYNGKVKTPSVTVKDSAGKTLKKNTDYTVTYASGRKNVGTYKVTIKMKGKYSGTKTLTFKINPAKTTVSKLTAGKKSITVAITKKSTQVTGYQIQYSTSKTFSKATTKTISSYKTTKYNLKSLSVKKTYYVKVRTYKKVGSTTYYSGWSTYKYKKTK